MKVINKHSKRDINTKLIFALVLAGSSMMMLSGCAGINGSFACNKTAGDTCSSIEQVNTQANEGAFNGVQSGAVKPTTVYSDQAVKPTGFHVNTPEPGAPIRFSESIARIWIAPFEDTSGNYHEPSYVYTVIHPSHWIGVPTSAIASPHQEG